MGLQPAWTTGLGWSLPGETHGDAVAPSLPPVQYLTHDWRLTLYALQFSELLAVNEKGGKVMRRVPVHKSLLSIPPSKLLLAAAAPGAGHAAAASEELP